MNNDTYQCPFQLFLKNYQKQTQTRKTTQCGNGHILELLYNGLETI